jgi:hypothetical protein
MRRIRLGKYAKQASESNPDWVFSLAAPKLAPCCPNRLAPNVTDVAAQ